MERITLLQRAEKYSMALAELYGGDTGSMDNPRDKYLLVLGAEVLKLRAKLQRMGAVMRDEPEDDE